MCPSDFPPSTPSPQVPLDDDQALRGIRRKTSQVSVIVSLFSLAVVAVAGWLFWTQRHTLEESRTAYSKAHEAGSTEAFLTKTRELLPRTDYDDLQVEMIQKLGQYRDVQAVPILTDQLKEAGVVRRAAALALAAIGLPEASSAKPTLLAVLKDSDERDRTQVIWALAVLREQSAAKAIMEAFGQGMLQAQPNFDPKVIVDAVGVDQLSASTLLESPQPATRLLVAQALAEEGSPSVVEPLQRLLQRELRLNPKDQSVEVVRTTLTGLGKTGQSTALATFFEVLEKQPGLKPGVLESIRKSTSAQGLIALLHHVKDSDMRQQLVRMLAATHDSRATDTLVGLVNDSDAKIRTYAAVGLAALGNDRGMPVLVELAASDNDQLATEALLNLRELRSPNCVAPLLQVMSKKPGRRASILRALGASGSAHAGPILMKELKGDDVEAAALALGELRYEPALGILLRMVKRTPGIDFTQPSRKSEQAYRNRLVAIRALGYYGNPVATAELKTVVEDTLDDARLRDMAGRMLAHVADMAFLTELTRKVRDTSLDQHTRMYYAQAFWQRPMPELAPAFMDIMADKALPWEIRRAAALGLGYISHPDYDAKLSAMLDVQEIRRAASLAVVLGGSEATGRKLLDVLLSDRETLELLEDGFLGEASDWFAIIPHDSATEMLRRLTVGYLLREGKGAQKLSFAWAYHVGRLKAGWPAPGGMDARTARHILHNTLIGQDAKARALAAEALDAMGERGILLAVRDSGGPGGAEARRVLYVPVLPN